MTPATLLQTEIQPQKVVKATKVRRTRQPRNPQLSVARRNERERNRVKMVNNGFALLREHLPVEDLQACEQSGSETPTPDGGSVSGHKSGKAKKYSKVETLRAAIQRIRMLEELIRSTEPGFESINITSSSSMLSAYDEEPLSVCEPLSCSSSSHSNSNQSNSLNLEPTRTPATASTGQLLYAASITNQTISTPHSQEHFVKLEPQQQLNMPSPQHPQASHTSSLNNHQTQQPSYQPSSTKVHLNLNLSQQQQHCQQTISMSLPQQQQQQPTPSHTHIWIQQHQNSFIEQQQYQQPSQQQTGAWYAQQQQQQHIEASSQKQSNWFTQQTPESPEQQHIQQQQQQPLGQQQQQQLVQVESPVWFNSSPVSVAQSTSSQPITFGHHHHHQHQHQISLYSQ